MSMEKFGTYTPTQQREIVSRLASAANKRLRTLEKSGIENPATLRVELSGGKFSVKGKSGQELKQELFRVKQFLGSKFSSKREWNKFEKKLEAKIKEDATEQDKNATKLAYGYFDVLQELEPSLITKRARYNLVEQIALYIKEGNSPKEVMNKAKQWLEDEYRKEQQRYNEQNVKFGERLNKSRKRYKRNR